MNIEDLAAAHRRCSRCRRPGYACRCEDQERASAPFAADDVPEAEDADERPAAPSEGAGDAT